MTTARVELRTLAQFVSACQAPTITQAARETGTAPSALSVGLHMLEDQLDVRLFLRQGNHLTPLPAAFWLFQEACAALHLEACIRDAASGKGPASRRRLQIRLDLAFTIGRFSKAINRSVAEMRGLDPTLFVDFSFLGSSRGSSDATEMSEHTALGEATRIDVGYQRGPVQAKSDPATPFYLDPWYAVSASDAPSGGDPLESIVVEMPDALKQAIGDHALKHGLSGTLTFIRDGPSELARLLTQHADARFLVPKSMLSSRLGLILPKCEPLEPPLVSRIGVDISGPDGKAARQFLACLSRNLEAPEENAVFRPELTARQIHYFNLVHRCGGISSAARIGNVTQPSISSQIQRMEAPLGGALFLRQRDGAKVTALGRRILPFTQAAEAKLSEIVRSSTDIAAHTQSSVSLGMLPSSGHDSLLTERIAQALTAAFTRHPDWRLRIVEASNTALHEQVRAGNLNLAIVGSVQGQMARIWLGPSERLSVVANPDVDLGEAAEISLEAACSLPLALGARHLSIHQAFVAAAEARHLRIRTVLEVGSLPLAIAMVRRAPICTVLPASSVRQDLAMGRLRARPISEDVISGNLAVIFSGERTLSDAERSIVQELVAAFGKAGEHAAVPELGLQH